LPAFSISGVKEATPQNSTPVHATAWEWKNARALRRRHLRVLDPKQEWLFQKRNLPPLRDSLTLNCSRSWI
jgi:hypothetical protein